VPMDLLLARFERIVLVDAVHLWPVRMRYALRRSVTFVTRDLTGALASLGTGETIARIDPLADIASDPRIDLVISANLLSQLPLPVVRAIDAGAISDQHLPRRVVEAHLDDLSAFNARICLLTDMSYSEVNAAGIVVETTDLLHGVKLAAPHEAWDWPVSPLGEEEAGAAFVHHVGGWSDWRAGR
jgi:hypothetical protein